MWAPRKPPALVPAASHRSHRHSPPTRGNACRCRRRRVDARSPRDARRLSIGCDSRGCRRVAGRPADADADAAGAHSSGVDRDFARRGGHAGDVERHRDLSVEHRRADRGHDLHQYQRRRLSARGARLGQSYCIPRRRPWRTIAGDGARRRTRRRHALHCYRANRARGDHRGRPAGRVVAAWPGRPCHPQRRRPVQSRAARRTRDPHRRLDRRRDHRQSHKISRAVCCSAPCSPRRRCTAAATFTW